MHVTAAKDGVQGRRRLRIFAAAAALVLLCAVCVGVSGAVTVTDWTGLNNAILNTPVGGSVEIIIGPASSGDNNIQINFEGESSEIKIVGKTVTISNHEDVNVVFMKRGYGTFDIFEVGENGKLTISGETPGSITLDRTAYVGSIFGEDFLWPYGSGVKVLSQGTFTMDGDVTIKSQRVSGSSEAAGVHVKSGGTFIMNGGSIVGNMATETLGGKSQAGGVFIEGGAKFTMSGSATINDNYIVDEKFVGDDEYTEVNFGGAGQYYIVRFHQNDGSEAEYYQTIPLNTNTQLTLNEYVREGYTFDKWYLNANGQGKSYADGASVYNLAATPGSVVDFYAQWIKESYTLTFDTNGGDPAVISQITASYGDSIDVPDVTKIGCEFTGWLDDEGNLFPSLNTMPDCGDNGATKHLTAQWLSTVQYTISIPEIITVNTDDQSAKISANIVSLPEGVNLNVVLSEKTTLNHVDLPSYGLAYVLYADGVSVNNDNSVAEFSLSNTASVTLTAKLAEGVNPKYSGTYIDTVKFTVLVDETGNT